MSIVRSAGLLTGDDCDQLVSPRSGTTATVRCSIRKLALATVLSATTFGFGCATTHPPLIEAELPPDESSAATGIDTFTVMAPQNVHEQDLGRPCDSSFNFISGEDGKAIYRRSSEPSRHKMTDTYVTEFTSSRKLEFALKVWGIEANAGNDSDTRYAAYRMYETKKLVEVDDRGIDPDPPAPEGAVWYIGAIYFGYSVEAIASGDSQSFHAGVAAKIISQDLGKFRAVVENNHLQTRIKTRGLARAAEKEFSAVRSIDDLTKYYREDEMPVPILVEYRSIPGTRADQGKAIEFAPIPPSYYSYTVQLDSAHISAPDRCGGGNCTLVIEVSRDGAGSKMDAFQCQRGTTDPHCELTIIPKATAEQLRKGFTIHAVDAGTNNDLGLCRLVTTRAQLEQIGNTKEKEGPQELQCTEAKLNLRILRNSPEDD